MQDGSNDEWMGSPEVGDWWMSNLTMERALEFAGYQVEHAWGEGTHSAKHATAVFPAAMRWLWKDWPQPISAGQSQNVFLKDILLPEESWQPVDDNGPMTRALSVHPQGYQTLGPEKRVYGTDTQSGKVWMALRNGKKSVIDAGLQGPTGIALSPDGLWLAVAESRTHWGYSYRIQPDGTVQDKQRVYSIHVPDDADNSGAGPWVMDREGRLYAATRLGLQVFDRNGGVKAILPVPGGAVPGVSFAGESLDTLYVISAEGKTYRRKLKVPGVAPGSAPIELPAGSPG